MSGGIGFTYCGDDACIQARPREAFFFPDPPDHDGIYCFGVGLPYGLSTLAGLPIFFPILPWGSYHTFQWQDGVYRFIPIRTTANLLLRAYVRPLLWAVLYTLGLLAMLILLAAILNPEETIASATHALGLGPELGLLLLGSVLGLAGLRAVDQRDRKIRLLMGPHQGGHSDPALWQKPMLQEVIDALPAGWLTEAYVERLLERGELAQAMFLARLAHGARAPWGRTVTRRVLRDPRARRWLEDLQRAPWQRESAANASQNRGSGPS